VYFEDRYGVNVERVLVTGVQNPQQLQEAFGDGNVRVEDLVSSAAAGVAAASVNKSVLAGVAGALIS